METSATPAGVYIPNHTAGVLPQYEYGPQKSYIIPPDFGHSAAEDPELYGDEDDDEGDLIDDPLNYQDWSSATGDFTKSYNRQRQLVEATQSPGTTQARRANPPKPKANVAARVDDQITSLAKFASRIKLGDVESGIGGGKGDRYITPLNCQSAALSKELLIHTLIGVMISQTEPPPNKSSTLAPG